MRCPAKKKKPSVTEEYLKGFDINVNALGELERNVDMDKINAFLDEKLKDKKLKRGQKEEEE